MFEKNHINQQKTNFILSTMKRKLKNKYVFFLVYTFNLTIKVKKLKKSVKKNTKI